MKSTGIAYILYFLFGGLGAHKFYLGKKGMGILYIALFLFGFIMVAQTSASLGKSTSTYFVPLLYFMLYDLFTIPRQVKRVNYPTLK